MEQLVEGMEQAILDSVQRGRDRRDEQWELEALRLLGRFRSLVRGVVTEAPEVTTAVLPTAIAGSPYELIKGERNSILRIDGRVIDLGTQNTMYMEVLIGRPNRVVSNTELSERLGLYKRDSLQAIYERVRDAVRSQYVARVFGQGVMFVYPPQEFSKPGKP